MKINELWLGVIVFWGLCIIGALTGPQLHGVGNIFVILLFVPIGWILLTGFGVFTGYLFRKGRLTQSRGLRICLFVFSALLVLAFLPLGYYMSSV